MNDAKYISLDVHQATISAVVLNSAGHLLMESILETKAATILQLLHGLSGSLHVTFEEGICAAWLHDLIQAHGTKVLVCDPRKNALLKAGNKNDQIDSRKRAELLCLDRFTGVSHGEHSVRAVKELSRSRLTISVDAARVMTRLKAVCRSWAIPCIGKQVYGFASTESPKSKYSRHDEILPPLRSTMIASWVTARALSLSLVTSQSHSIAALFPSGDKKTFFTVMRASPKCVK
jgi:transposase